MKFMILRVINSVKCIEHPTCQEMTNDTREILIVFGDLSLALILFVHSL